MNKMNLYREALGDGDYVIVCAEKVSDNARRILGESGVIVLDGFNPPKCGVDSCIEYFARTLLGLLER